MHNFGQLQVVLQGSQRSLNEDPRFRTAYTEQFFESAPEGVVVADSQGCVVRINREFTRMFGYESAEVFGRRLAELIAPEDKRDESLALERYLASGGRFNVESVRQRKDKLRLDVAIIGVPLQLDGERAGWFLIYRDITARRRTEHWRYALQRIAEFADSETDLRTFCGAVHGIVAELMFAQNFGIALYNEETGLLSWPYLVDEQLEIPSRPRPLQQGLTEYVLRSGQPLLATRELIAQLQTEGKVEIGEPFPASWLGIPLRTGPGASGGVLAVQSYQEGTCFGPRELETLALLGQQLATTLRHRQDRESSRNFELHRNALFEHAVHGMYRFNRNGRLIRANAALAKMLGYASAAEVVALDFAREVFLDPGEFPRLTAAVPADTWTVHETRWKRQDGKLLAVRLSVTTFPHPNTYETVVEDVTPWRALEEQVRHGQKMEAVGRLAGGVAHDFNNLLTVIGGYSDMMAQRIAPTDSLHVPLEEIRKATERAVALARQLLAFSRRQVLSPRVLDLNAVVGNMENLLRRLLGEDIEISAVLSPALGRVRADSGQIEQVVMNLAINARDAMPNGGKLLIESASVVLDETYALQHPDLVAGRYVMLAVTDTGCGISKEVRSRIFEPFFTTKSSGTGLGLSMVYGIVKQSGGHVWVSSEVGRGTTFKIYLPEVEGKTETVGAPLHHTALPRGSETILIVEDEEGVRTLLHTFLEQLGYTVLCTCNGAEALIVCERHRGPIHLLLTDMVLPQVTGPELATRLLNLRPEIRVLYISGYTQDTISQQKGVEPGAAFLQKPFSAKTLAEKIRHLLDAGK
jgi:PAS domain S-box-containing protein